jgi:hypothetical protein
MARDDGFAIADVSTAIIHDTKFGSLYRVLKDPGQQARAFTIYVATVTGSWAAGQQVTADDVIPWWMDDPAPALAGLVQVGLLDADHRIPDHAWASWFGPAWERREAKREGGRRGGQASWQVRSEGKPKHSSSRPSGELNPSDPSARPSDPSLEPVVDLTCPRCGGVVDDTDMANVVVRDRGRGLQHHTCPAQGAA